MSIAIRRPFGTDDRLPCATCGQDAYLSARSPHPELGENYELQTFVCRSCKASTRRSVDIDGQLPKVGPSISHRPPTKSSTSKAAEYRARGRQCRDRAGESTDAHIRGEFERLAARWDAFATQEEENDFSEFEKHFGKR
jgi:hypothetical protein